MSMGKVMPLQVQGTRKRALNLPWPLPMDIVQKSLHDTAFVVVDLG